MSAMIEIPNRDGLPIRCDLHRPKGEGPFPLVLVAHGPDAAPVELEEGDDLVRWLGEGRLAMALVDAVPAGIYTLVFRHAGAPKELRNAVGEAAKALVRPNPLRSARC